MFEIPQRTKIWAVVMIVIGLLSAGYGFLSAPSSVEDVQEELHSHSAGDAHHAGEAEEHHDEAGDEDHHAEHVLHQLQNRPWAALLLNNFFFLAVSLGALFFLAVQYAAKAGWAIVLQRIMEAMAGFLWIPGLIMIVLVLLGMYHGHHLWHWTAEGIMDPESENYDKIIAGKEAFLNPLFFIVRSVIYIAGWVWAAKLLRKWSLREDAENGLTYYKRSFRLSAGFLVFFAVTSSVAAWDWIMSIDTHWFSTLFGWYTFAGLFVSALSAIALMAIYLKSKGYLPELDQNHLQDLGKFMFAFSIFWTYLWFSQFMLIWYSNIPEEVTYFMARFDMYKVSFFTMLVMNFLFPFLLIMSRDSKRNRGFLMTAGIVLIAGHWLDHFVMIMPGTVGEHGTIGIPEIGIFVGYFGLFILVVFRALGKAPLLPENHPMLLESKHHHI